ncbi:MAG TPA: hypothetical protein VK177_20135 [Flavobacteriales bacterium]|nr:hypothetical protein [Flavobacteriales bacterium]
MKKLLVFIIAICFGAMAFTTPGKGDKPSKSVTELLKYYKENYEVLSKINMVYNYNGNKPGSSSSKDINTNYAVDFKGTEKYLTGIKKSGFVGQKLIDKLRNHFLKCEKDFKDNPQNSGVPRGFENDFLMLNDDFMNDLNNLQKIEIMDEAIRSNASATVKVKFPSGNVRVYDLAKQNDIWLVSEITM